MEKPVKPTEPTYVRKKYLLLLLESMYRSGEVTREDLEQLCRCN